MKLLVISNCAALSYERIFSCILPKAQVSSLHINKLDSPDINLSGHDFVLCLKSHVHKLPQKVANSSQIITIPNFHFSGYHPDTSYVVSAKNHNVQVPSPAGSYHSTIAFSAFQSGLSVEKALSLYNGDTYTQLGFLNEYDKSKNSFLTTYRDSNLNIDNLFRKWSRKGCFMHTINHPHNFCFVDIAKEICQNNFEESIDYPHIFPDILAGSMIFPCYPEVAERRGTNGSYIFKISGEFKCMDLKTFVTESFRKYDNHGTENIMIASPFRDAFNSASEYALGA